LGYEVHVSEPKTAKGRRSLALDPATVAALRQHRARAAGTVARLILGDSGPDSEPAVDKSLTPGIGP
jgi:hypothetical protein